MRIFDEILEEMCIDISKVSYKNSFEIYARNNNRCLEFFDIENNPIFSIFLSTTKQSVNDDGIYSKMLTETEFLSLTEITEKLLIKVSEKIVKVGANDENILKMKYIMEFLDILEEIKIYHYEKVVNYLERDVNV